MHPKTLKKEIEVYKKYIVRLAEKERVRLAEIVKKGGAPAYEIKHANILLKADADGPAWRDAKIAEAFSAHPNTAANVRKRFAESGLEAALGRKKPAEPPNKPKLDGEGEARLIALRCGEPPEGRSRWTLRLLADKAVELEIVDSVSHVTVGKAIKKTNSSRISKNNG